MVTWRWGEGTGTRGSCCEWVGWIGLERRGEGGREMPEWALRGGRVALSEERARAWFDVWGRDERGTEGVSCRWIGSRVGGLMGGGGGDEGEGGKSGTEAGRPWFPDGNADDAAEEQ